MNSPTKICFFDMEGTLLKKDYALDNGKVAPSAWTVAAKLLGEECYQREEASKDKWLSGGYSGYLEWMNESINILVEHGFQRSTLQKVIESSRLHDGAEELVKHLHSLGIVTVIISGGFKALATKLQIKLGIKHAFSACEFYFDRDGKVSGVNLLPADEEGKVAFMQQMAIEYGVPLSDCIFIGDGKNDVHIAVEAGLSISFNGQPELNAVANHCIYQPQGYEDLSDVIKLF